MNPYNIGTSDRIDFAQARKKGRCYSLPIYIYICIVTPHLKRSTLVQNGRLKTHRRFRCGDSRIIFLKINVDTSSYTETTPPLGHFKLTNGSFYRRGRRRSRRIIDGDVVAARVQYEMGEERQSPHGQRAAPHVQRVITVLPSVGDAQEHVPRFERAPDVITHRIQPKERSQGGDVEQRVCKWKTVRLFFCELTRYLAIYYFFLEGGVYLKMQL